mgnify:CR=1 FL=1
MKKAFLMVLACLLLAGCGAPSETVTPTDSWPDSALAETNEAAGTMTRWAFWQNCRSGSSPSTA